MEINKDKVKKFWEYQADRLGKVPLGTLTHFEVDEGALALKIELEMDKILKQLRLTKEMNVLDLGAGTGIWSFIFANLVNSVHAVEFSKKLIDIGTTEAEKQSVDNVKFFHERVEDFTSDISFDIIFISGVLQYLNDPEFNTLVNRFTTYSDLDTKLVLREPTGVNSRYKIDAKYSEKLGTDYSSIYRTEEELVGPIEDVGFRLEEDMEFYDDETGLNKWDQTILRLYIFKRVN